MIVDFRSALLSIVVHPERFTIIWGVSSQQPPVCSIHLDDASAATGKRRQCIYHTPATGGEERGSKSQSSGWGLLGGHDWQGPVAGIWPGHRGYTPTLYEKSHGIFNNRRESGPRFNVSSEGWCFFLQYSVPITILGCKDPHRPQGEHPLLASLTPLPTVT